MGAICASPTEIGSCEARPRSRRKRTFSRKSRSKAILKLTSRTPLSAKDAGSVASSEWRVYIGRCTPTGAGKRIGLWPDIGGTKTKLPFVKTAGSRGNFLGMVWNKEAAGDTG